ncbi:hypothetical protein L218DRAFT_456589 [Marasmius fiardii PR-910]|nr:hypothetical protein L218DRAFT_456589 [Marasmius fiardii PR-910]
MQKSVEKVSTTTNRLVVFFAMTIDHNSLTFLKLALVLVSSLSFRHTFTPPRNNSDTPSPRVAGKGTGRQIDQHILAFLKRLLPLFIITFEIASLNEILFILHTEFPERFSQLDIIYSRIPLKGSARLDNNERPLIKLLFLSLTLAGQLIRLACYHAFRGTYRFDVSAGGKNEPLITDGPYSIVRHPGYTALWFVVIGIVGYHLSPGTWIHVNLFDIPDPGSSYYYYCLATAVGLWVVSVSAVPGFLSLRTKDEDELLKECFGEAWERWRSVVRYSLVPGVY